MPMHNTNVRYSWKYFNRHMTPLPHLFGKPPKLTSSLLNAGFHRVTPWRERTFTFTWREQKQTTSTKTREKFFRGQQLMLKESLKNLHVLENDCQELVFRIGQEERSWKHEPFIGFQFFLRWVCWLNIEFIR